MSEYEQSKWPEVQLPRHTGLCWSTWFRQQHPIRTEAAKPRQDTRHYFTKEQRLHKQHVYEHTLQELKCSLKIIAVGQTFHMPWNVKNTKEDSCSLFKHSHCEEGQSWKGSSSLKKKIEMAAKQNHGHKNANILPRTMNVSPASHPCGN